MKYTNGLPVLLGDKVDLGGGMLGVIVAIIGEGKYIDGYSANEWGYLLTGVLIESGEAGLVHYPTTEGGLNLIERKSV